MTGLLSFQLAARRCPANLGLKKDGSTTTLEGACMMPTSLQIVSEDEGNFHWGSLAQ